MRIFTCTPRPYEGNAAFFGRDSGLLCRGFLRIGIHSRAVMPGRHMPDDEPDLIRTDYRNLKDPAWWKNHRLDAVVLYAWGRPRYAPIARAIRKSGTFLVLNQDSGGLISPISDPADWVREQIVLAGGRPLRALPLILRGLTIGMTVTDPLRALHLRQGNVIACVSPSAVARYKKICRFYGGNQLASRVQLVPHPIQNEFRHSTSSPRYRQVVCVGRWDDEVQKRPKLLTSALTDLCSRDPLVSVRIAGPVTPFLETWHAALPVPARKQITILGPTEHSSLPKLFSESQVFYSSSAFESFGIAAAEALCCGCSVIAERSNSLSSFEWFVAENSGRLVEGANPRQHSAAITQELDEWKTGNRNPSHISKTWAKRLHSDQVAKSILKQALLRI